MNLEFYFWPGDQFNPAELAIAYKDGERFKVSGLGNVFRQSPITRKQVENPANGWIKLVPATD
jgi:hypothetical protein